MIVQKNMELSTHVGDECAFDYSELVLEQKMALDLFVGNCFDAEYNGGAMLGYGMSGGGKLKLIANIAL